MSLEFSRAWKRKNYLRTKLIERKTGDSDNVKHPSAFCNPDKGDYHESLPSCSRNGLLFSEGRSNKIL